MAAYAIVDAAGVTLTVAEWDGVTPFDPGPGLSLVPAADAPPMPAPPPAELRGIDVFLRLGFAKVAGMYAAAQQSPEIAALLGWMTAARYLDRSDPLLAMGCQALVDAGVLTADDVTTALA